MNSRIYGLIKSAGTSVHGDGVIDVLGCPYGGPIDGADFDGEYFDETTNFMEDALLYPPVFYHHGKITKSTTKLVGRILARWTDTRGVWYRVKLALGETDPAYSKSYAKMLWDKAKEGLLYASSGAIEASIKRGKGGLIQQWLVGELSLIDIDIKKDRYPANPYAIAMPTVSTYLGMSKSGRNLFGNTYTRALPFKKRGLMNEERVINSIESAAFGLFDWLTASNEAGNVPEQEAINNAFTSGVRRILEDNPQIVPKGDSIDSIVSSLMSGINMGKRSVESAENVASGITTLLGRAIPALAPEDEGEQMDGVEKLIEAEDEGAEESAAPTKGGGTALGTSSEQPEEKADTSKNGSVKKSMINPDDEVEPDDDEPDDDEDKRFEGKFLKALASETVQKAFKSMFGDSMGKSTKSADPTQLLPVDSELLSTMVSTGLMTDAESESLSSLFATVRNNSSSTKSGGGASQEADVLRALVKRAYAVSSDATIVNGAGNDGPDDVSNVIANLKSYM